MSIIRRWNGRSWVETTGIAKRFNGSSFVDAVVRRFNGRSWDVISKKEYTTTYNSTWTASYNGSGAHTARVRNAVWGDTLSHYALWYGNSISTLASWNSIPNPHRIYAGRRYVVDRTAMGRRRNTNGLMHQGEKRVGALENNHGREGSMIGFDSARIRNDLSGAEILRCEVYVRCHQSGNNTNRVRAVFGYHNNSSRPNQFAHNQYWAQSEWFNQGQGKWVTIPNSLGERLRDGRVRGVTLYANGNDQGYVGTFHGKNNSNPPRLRITYKK